jgi:hypothetical protein
VREAVHVVDLGREQQLADVSSLPMLLNTGSGMMLPEPSRWP